MNTVNFTINVTIPKQTVEDLLVCAFEGGSNYWYDQLEPIEESITKGHASEKFYGNMMKHGFTLVDKETGHKHAVLPKQFAEALKLMHDEYMDHFKDVKNENSDATTGDVFLQLLVHGDVVYG